MGLLAYRICSSIDPGSLTENVSAIVAGDARPHGKVTYILAGISVFFLLLTACWATLIIRQGFTLTICSVHCSTKDQFELLQ